MQHLNPISMAPSPLRSREAGKLLAALEKDREYGSLGAHVQIARLGGERHEEACFARVSI